MSDTKKTKKRGKLGINYIDWIVLKVSFLHFILDFYLKIQKFLLSKKKKKTENLPLIVFGHELQWNLNKDLQRI